MRFAILGGGRWGTAIGVHLSRIGHEVLIYDINDSAVAKINAGVHPYVEDLELPKGVTATTDISQVTSYENLVCALPVQKVREVFSSLKVSGKNVINASKGLEIGTFKRVSEIIKETSEGVNVFALSGPSFAEEVSRGLPTALVLAYEDYRETAEELQRAISSENFRVYLNDDIVGVELGGALKNVMAIACGISDGLGLGHNARAGLITRGLMEMTRIGVSMGAKEKTFYGLSGLGDLVLTATSDLSRNRTFGYLLGSGLSLESALERIGQVVEGVKTVEALKDLTDKENIHAPITSAVYKVVVDREDIGEVIRQMLLRLPKEEFLL